MMRTLTLLFTLFLLSAALRAQSESNLLAKLILAVDKDQYEQATALFRQMISDNVEHAEIFYWVHLDKHPVLSPRLANELAVYFEEEYDYDKAGVFYKEYTRFYPDDINGWLALAKVEVLCGKEEEAIHTYERILTEQPDNLDANIYAANFYLLQGKLEMQQIEQDYKRIPSPTRMQYAHYRNRLDKAFKEKFVKARTHFEAVLKQFPSVAGKKSLLEIEKVRRLVEW